MAHDAFISYSLEDKPVAEAICAHLETARIRCWIAPRDLARHRDARKATERAIAHSRVLVLVFSAHANASDEITRELYLGAKANAVLIPVKLDDTVPVLEKQFYLGRPQWHATRNPPTAEQLQLLVERVQAVLKRPGPEPKRTGLAWFYLIPSVLILLGLLAGLVFLVASAQVGALRLPTPIPIAADASAKLTWTPSPTLIRTATPVTTPIPAITLTPTRIPGVPIPNVISGQAVIEETFSKPQYDGTLPPSFSPDCSDMSVQQKDGQLEFLPNLNRGVCRLDFRVSLKPQQFRYFDARFQFSDGSIDTQLPVGIGLDLVSPTQSERLGVTCLHSFSGFECDVGYAIHEPIYYTPTTIFIKPNTWTFARIELTNPELFEWTFFMDNIPVGTYTMPVEQVARWRTGTLEFYVFENPLALSSQIVHMDDLTVLAR